MTLKLHHFTLEESILSNLNQFSLNFSVLQTVPFMLENKLLFELCAKKTIKATLYAEKTLSKYIANHNLLLRK